MPIRFSGLVVPFQRRHVLVYGPEAEALSLAEPLFGPPVFLRPGYRLFARNDYVLPVAMVDDIGQRFEPPESYEWIELRGELFPRADLVGELLSGEPHTAFMKEVDLAELAVFAVEAAAGRRPVRLDLALDARAVPGNEALAPAACPPELDLFARALPCYRLAPGTFGAVAAAIVSQLLATGRRDWQLTFDDLDETYDQ